VPPIPAPVTRAGCQASLQAPSVDGPIQLAVRDPAGAGIDRAADWLADAGYEVVDAEPAGDR
jgi:hypothetical protein